jgi:hypothetical protein
MYWFMVIAKLKIKVERRQARLIELDLEYDRIRREMRDINLMIDKMEIGESYDRKKNTFA